MILADTSVWVEHLRRGDLRLAQLLRENQIVCHPDVIGELACGHIKNRVEVLSLLGELDALPRIGDDEGLDFIDRHRLMGCGLGWVDVHLLGACVLAQVQLWTRDRRLAEAALRLGLAAS